MPLSDTPASRRLSDNLQGCSIASRPENCSFKMPAFGAILRESPLSMTVRTLAIRLAIYLAALLAVLPSRSHGEAMLQYFNTSWNSIAQKMPELAEAGYDSLWLPPPTNAGGGLSVGYDL